MGPDEARRFPSLGRTWQGRPGGVLFASMRSVSGGSGAVADCVARRRSRGYSPRSAQPLQAELATEAAEPAAAQLAEQVLRVDAELAEQVGVLVGVDLVRQLRLRLAGGLGVAGVTAALEELDDLLLVDLHDVIL